MAKKIEGNANLERRNGSIVNTDDKAYKRRDRIKKERIKNENRINILERNIGILFRQNQALQQEIEKLKTPKP